MNVAPHVGAWIEIIIVQLRHVKIKVAPHVGAWIEIIICSSIFSILISRTSRRCVD